MLVLSIALLFVHPIKALSAKATNKLKMIFFIRIS